MIDQPTTILSKVGSKAMAYDAQFRVGVKAVRTVHFINENGVHLYIDVDRNSVPVAVSLVHSPTAGIEYTELPEGQTDHLLQLFSFASQMVLADQQARQFLRDARATQFQWTFQNDRNRLFRNVTDNVGVFGPACMAE